MWTYPSTIACTVAIYWLFRGFERWGVSSTWAITINYGVAAALGWTMAGGMPSLEQSLNAPWMPAVALMGLAFYPLFRLTARCTQSLGVSVASIATKLSMAIPIVAFTLADGLGNTHWGQWAGVALAFPAVILASSQRDQHTSEADAPTHTRTWWRSLHWMPMVMFAGSGAIDTVFGWFAQSESLNDPAMQFAFASVPFSLGAVVGLLDLLRQRAALPRRRDLLGGSALGVVNFGSLYFLLLAYDANLLDRAMVVPTLNLSVIVLATLGGMWLFRDRMDASTRWGVALAGASIALTMLFA